MLGATSAIAGADLLSSSCGPSGQVLLRRPVLKWIVWGDKGSRIAKIECNLNGRPVPASYDEGERVAFVRLSQPLPTGSYRVEMRAHTSDDIVFRKQWEFAVRPDALDAIEQPTTLQRTILDHVNDIRAELRLPPAKPNDLLNFCAQRHSDYLAANSATGHYQKEGLPLFFGATPTDRLAACGYTGSSSEVVIFGRSDLRGSIEKLFTAPYHRLPFMQPSPVEVGGGSAGERVVVLFGGDSGDGVVVSPYDGQRNVATKWVDLERPDPLRIHPGLDRPIGYPIVFSCFTNDYQRIRLVSARLQVAANGTDVPIAINSPDNDSELTDSVFLLPRTPLSPETTYKASVEITLPNGARAAKIWKFTTRS